MCKECNAYFCINCSNVIHNKPFFNSHKILNYIFCIICKQEKKDTLADIHCATCNKDYCSYCCKDYHSRPDLQSHLATVVSLVTKKKESSELELRAAEIDRERSVIGLLSCIYINAVSSIVGVSALGVYYTVKINHTFLPNIDKLYTLKIFCKTNTNSQLNIAEQQQYEMECIEKIRKEKKCNSHLMSVIGMFKDHPVGIFESDMSNYIYPPITTFLIMENYPSV